MDKTIQVCNKCNASLAIGLKLHFCPFCGTVQLEKKLLYGKSTEHYDPRNPGYKPWRDGPTVPKRIYKAVDVNKRPWCPAMRQPHVRQKKVTITNSTEENNGETSRDGVPQCDLETNDVGNNIDELGDSENALESPPEFEVPFEPFIGRKFQITHHATMLTFNINCCTYT